MSNLISAAALADLLDSDVPVRLLDVRWRLGVADSRPEYLAGHLPGAVYVDLGTELAEPDRPSTEGRHPLPDIHRLRAAVRRWGVQPGEEIVVYDDADSLPAARAWWLLSHAGLTGVRVLDGGLSAWAGLRETGEVTPEPGTREVPGYGHRRVLDIDQAAELARTGMLIDSRAAARFRGDTEPLDPRAGHIPGAQNLPATEYLRNGKLLPVEELRALFATRDIHPERIVGTTCGSGITAAHTALALAEAGIDAALFPGSWSQWSNLPEYPVETGDPRAADG